MVLLAAEAWWPALLSLSLLCCFFSFLLLLLFCFFLLSFPFLFSSFLLCPLSFSPFFFLFSSVLPCFYRQKQGGTIVVGRPLLAAPPLFVQRIKRRQVGIEWWASYCAKTGKEVRRKGRRKIFFFPCLARPGEEEDLQCRQNGTVLGFCFFFLLLLFCNSE